MELRNININDYDYNLPEDRIAIYPLEKRDNSNLLLMQNGELSKDKFFNIDNYIPADSLIVFNNTKVINARLHFRKETGALIEVFCLEPIKPADYSISLSSTKVCTWKCLVGNSKKWKSGSLSQTLQINGNEINLAINRLAQIGNSFEIQFEWNNVNVHFSDILESVGNIPIPPYLNRESEENDKARYQTVYSKPEGSVAAPTAGLHFTNDIFDRLNKKKVTIDFVTLHVGAGTFHPVKADKIIEHEMHTEHFTVSKNNIQNLINYLGNITVVGTTSVRTLESLFAIACKVYLNKTIIDNSFVIEQWEAYKPEYLELNKISKKVLENLLDWMNKNNFPSLSCSTQIMIVPGYDFILTNRLITNFHQPKSTLLVLLSAFIGKQWKDAYEFAMHNNFRFLSYGDSSIFFKNIKLL